MPEERREPLTTNLPADGGESGEKQRVRIHVPTEDTWLVLGEKHKDGGYGGASMFTQGHAFVSANETMALQSREQALLQSWEDEVFVAGSKGVVVTTPSGAFVTGGGGVFIAGGVGMSPAQRPMTGTTTTEMKLEPIEKAKQNMEETKGICEKTAGVLSGVAGIIGGDVSVLGALGALAGLAQIVNALATHEESKHVNIYGETGLAATTPKGAFIGAGIEAVTAAGVLAEMLSGVKAEVAAGVLASVFAGVKAALEGGVKAEVIAGKEVEIASRFDEVKVVAPTIKIGEKAAAPPQAPTDAVEIETTFAGKIALDAGLGSVKLELDSREVVAELKSDHKIELEAHSEIVLSVGKWKVEIKKEAIEIGLAKADKGSPEEPAIVLDEDKIQLKLAQGEILINKNGQASLGFGSTGLSCHKNGDAFKIKGGKCDIL